MGAAAPKPLLAHSSRQQADGYSGNTNKIFDSHDQPAAGISRDLCIGSTKNRMQKTTEEIYHGIF